MGGGTISNSETKIESIRLQSSTYGAVVPLFRGVTRLPGNMLWYDGFKATPHTTTQRAGKGGGTKVKNTTYTYSAHVAMALAEGPILGVPRIWRGKKNYSGGLTSANIGTASHSYTVPGGGGAVTVTNAATWAATVAVYYTGTLDQGDGTTTGPIFLAAGTDYTTQNGVYTFGAALAGVTITIEYQYIPTGEETGLAQLGMTKFAGKVGQSTWSLLSSSYADKAVPYSGIAYVAAQDYDLGGDASVENHNFELQGPMAYHLGATIPDVDPALFAADVLPDARYGAQFPASRLNLGLWSRYCRAAGLLLSPELTEQTSAAEVLAKLCQLTNSAAVWSAGSIKVVPFGDTALSGNGATFTPYNTAVYALDDSAFLPGADGGEPVEVSYKPRADAWNHVRLEFLDRSADYNIAIAEAKDQADIDALGLRSADIIPAHWIKDATVARQVAQLILQRALYIRATYKFRLPWTFARLEPMDLVTITDAGLGLSGQAVRILSIEEGDDGTLEVEAEDAPAGVAAAVLYPSQQASGYIANFNAAPGNVSAPVIFEAPAALTTTGLEVYAAVTGTGASWGGCSVWCSLDGVSYYNAGTVYGGARYGTITGPVSAGALPVSILAGQLVAASAADAAAYTSLCYVGGSSPEYFAHQGATLTGALAYSLGGLVRSGYGTTASNHTTGDPFARVDSAIGKSGALSADMVGKTIYFKFTSFNIYGAAEQDLAAVSAYTYTVTGYMLTRGPAILNYIKATNGTQLKNGVGSITLEARRVTDGADSLLSSGSVQLYVGTTLVTAANGFGTGSNGYTGVFDSTDISGALVVTLRDGPTGTIYGSLTLSNVTDGTNGTNGTPGLPGDPGASAVSAFLTVPSVSLMAYADGTVSSFAPASGQVKVYSGATDVTASATFAEVSETGCTGAITAGGAYSISAMSADTATYKVSATYSGNTFQLTLSLSKSKVGFEIVSALPSSGNFTGRMVFLTTDSKLYRYTGSAWTAAVDGADIAATSISAGKFASGIEPVTVVSSVPGTKSTNSIFNTTDGKLYRWNGSSYVATVATTDLSGAITSTQITDGAVSTAKMTANSISGDRIAAGTLDASKIVADSITSGQIAAGAITASEIAAGAITAEKLSVYSRGDSATVNPSFEEVSSTDSTMASGWARFTVWGGTSTTAFRYTGNYKSGNACMCLVPGAGQAADVMGTTVPVVPGETWALSMWVMSSGTNAGTSPGFYIRVRGGANWYNNNVEAYEGGGITWVTGPGENAPITPAATWVKYEVIVTIPAGMYWAAPCLLNYSTNTGHTVYIDDVSFRKITTSAMIADGAITAAKILAGSITADRINVGNLVASFVGANQITASNIDSRGLSIKDGSGNVILAAGTPLSSSNITPDSGWLNSNVTATSIGAVKTDASNAPASILNSSISIGSNGALSGAGGGTVTIAGLDNTVVRSVNPITSTNVSTYIAAAAIDYARIASVDAGTISVGSMSASRITAGTITADRFQAGNGVNLLAIVAGQLNTSITAAAVGPVSVPTLASPQVICTTAALTQVSQLISGIYYYYEYASDLTGNGTASMQVVVEYSVNGGTSWSTLVIGDNFTATTSSATYVSRGSLGTIFLLNPAMARLAASSTFLARIVCTRGNNGGTATAMPLIRNASISFNAMFNK